MTPVLTDNQRAVLTCLYERTVGSFRTVIISVSSASYLGIEQSELDALAAAGLVFRHAVGSVGLPVYLITPAGIRAIGGDIEAARHNFSHRRWWPVHLAMVANGALNIDDDIITDEARWLVNWSLLPTAQARVDAWIEQKKQKQGKE